MELTDRSKVVLSTLVVILFVFMLFLAAEGLTRIRQYFKYGSFGNITQIVVDPETGLRTPVAGSRTARISINSLGFRGPEIETPKPGERLRIGFLGASTTYCAEVSGDDMVWTALMHDSLEAAFPGLSVDYVNGGVPGYTTSASLANLEKRVAPLQPDIVVIYHATNDLSDETRTLAVAAGIKRANLAAEESWFGRYSLLWALVEKNLALMNLQQNNTEMLPLDASKLGASFRQNLIELVDRAKEHGAEQVVLVTFSFHLREGMDEKQQRAAMASARYYMPYLSADSLLAGFKRYNDIIREVAEDKGAILIENENTIPGDSIHFVDTVHFTDKGSQRQAERIMAGLMESQAFLQLMMRFNH